jgi:hypothetical protein
MSMERKLPYFKDEAEEARWWYDHREEVGAEIIKAAREGTTGPGAVARLREKLRAQEAVQAEQNSLTSSGS